MIGINTNIRLLSNKVLHNSVAVAPRIAQPITRKLQSLEASASIDTQLALPHLSGASSAIVDAQTGTLNLVRRFSPMELHQVEQTLAHGTITFEYHSPARGVKLLPRVRINAPEIPSGYTDAVLKYTDQPQEIFGYRVAKALGISYLATQSQLRPDTSLAIKYIDGVTLAKNGITDSATLRNEIVSYYKNIVGMNDTQAQHSARIDHELLAFFDWFTANRDRKPENIIQRNSDSAIVFIDQGGSMRGEREKPLQPLLKPQFYTLSDHTTSAIQLSDDVRRHIKQSLTDDIITQIHREFALIASRHIRTDTSGSIDHAWHAILARGSSEEQLKRLLARRDAAAKNGVLHFQPVTRATRIEDLQLHADIPRLYDIVRAWGKPPDHYGIDLGDSLTRPHPP